MQVKDIMSSDVNVVKPSTTIAAAARLMREGDLGALPVGEGDQLLGMMTDRDIVVRAVAEGKDCTSTPVSETMSDEVLYCFEDQDTEEVAANMGDRQLRRLPVVNRDKRLVGIVSLGDISKGVEARESGSALKEVSESS